MSTKFQHTTTLRTVRDRLLRAFDYATKVPPSALDQAEVMRKFKYAAGVNWHAAESIVKTAMARENELVRDAAEHPAMKAYLEAAADAEKKFSEMWQAMLAVLDKTRQAGGEVIEPQPYEKVWAATLENVQASHPEAMALDGDLTEAVKELWDEPVVIELYRQPYEAIPLLLASGWWPVLAPMLTGLPEEFCSAEAALPVAVADEDSQPVVAEQS